MNCDKSLREHAWPVLDISVVEDTAIVIFDSQESAKKAVDTYDGGILEASKNRETGPTSLTLHPRSTGSSWLEEWLGPLGRCHMRRGAGWITIFQATIAKQLKKDQRGWMVGWLGGSNGRLVLSCDSCIP